MEGLATRGHAAGKDKPCETQSRCVHRRRKGSTLSQHIHAHVLRVTHASTGTPCVEQLWTLCLPAPRLLRFPHPRACPTTGRPDSLPLARHVKVAFLSAPLLPWVTSTVVPLPQALPDYKKDRDGALACLTLLASFARPARELLLGSQGAAGEGEAGAGAAQPAALLAAAALVPPELMVQVGRIQALLDLSLIRHTARHTGRRALGRLQ